MKRTQEEIKKIAEEIRLNVAKKIYDEEHGIEAIENFLGLNYGHNQKAREHS